MRAVLPGLTGEKWLMASLMYGAGLRLMECLRLRVQDIDFARGELGPPRYPGSPWAQKRQHDHDLHSRIEQRRPGFVKCHGWALIQSIQAA
jgi:integrase